MSFADWTRTEPIAPATPATPATSATDRGGNKAPVAHVATVAASREDVLTPWRRATEAEGNELRLLVRKVGVFYAYTEAMHVEALHVALSDPVAALTSYRLVAKERGL